MSRSKSRYFFGITALVALGACSNKEKTADNPPAGQPSMSADTSAPITPSAGFDTTRGTREIRGVPIVADVSLGDKIFHGRANGGTCFSCHGQNAKGTTLAPDLTDGKWINTDGSREGIEKIVKNGVAKPKEHQAPMPPMGGAKLTDAQVQAVAAYVFSLSH
jgi:mono/diheme cytochrome c family protein